MEKEIKPMVVAGNYSEFMNFCRENKLNPHKGECVYLDNDIKIRGIRNIGERFKLYTIGTWAENDKNFDLINDFNSRI